MSFYKFIQDKVSWEDFLFREQLREFPDKQLIRSIKAIINKEKYKEFTESFLSDFKIPKKVQLSEINSSKKRIVYVYPGLYRTILKITNYYMVSKYSDKFCINSLAYAEGRSVKSAFNLIDEYKITKKDIVYKTDFSDYFNTININILEPKLKEFLQDDELFKFIIKLLKNPKVLIRDKVVEEHNKGVMAGSPIAGTLANIYMHEVDNLMLERNYRYIRYADDVLIIGKEAYDFFLEQIKPLEIHINPDKTKLLNIDTGITFLGFLHKGKIIDISEKALKKMRSRFKRRAKWYRVWMLNKNVKPKVAVRDYIKKLNYKLYSDQDDSINWSRWYLPNINTIESIKYLDNYFVKCIRYLYSGKWQGKHHYKLKYNDIKQLGFKSLVNEYYKLRRQKNSIIELELEDTVKTH